MILIISIKGSRAEFEKDFIVEIPQAKPLSPGEILGCTAPKLKNSDFIVYFFFFFFFFFFFSIEKKKNLYSRYDPYSKIFSREYYEIDEMKNIRQNAINIGIYSLISKSFLLSIYSIQFFVSIKSKIFWFNPWNSWSSRKS